MKGEIGKTFFAHLTDLSLLCCDWPDIVIDLPCLGYKN